MNAYEALQADDGTWFVWSWYDDEEVAADLTKTQADAVADRLNGLQEEYAVNEMFLVDTLNQAIKTLEAGLPTLALSAMYAAAIVYKGSD